MADTYTPFYNLTCPQIGLSDTTWGNKLNDNWDKIDAAIKAAFDAIDEYAPPTGLAVRGMILPWNGSVATIPTGWALCDGTNGTPDTRGYFIRAINSGTSGATSGSTTTGMAGGHSHNTMSAGGHNHGGVKPIALTIDQIPSHDHGGGVHVHNLGWTGVQNANLTTTDTLIAYINPQYAGVAAPTVSVTSLPATPTLNTDGSGQAHGHTLSNGGEHIHQTDSVPNHTHDITPDHYTFCLIMKL